MFWKQPIMPPVKSLVGIVLLSAGVSLAHLQPPNILPAPLYFIGDGAQIWRMETDGETLTQVTHEDAPIIYFDVSPEDGALVYVADNDLIRADESGEARTLLLDGITFIKPEDTGEGSLERLHGAIRSPRWSLNGEQVAFAMGGIHVIPSQGGDPQLLLPSLVSEAEDDPMMAFLSSTSYLPESWSPDGSRLIVQVLMPPEQGGLAILNLADGALIPVTNQEYGSLTCCHPSWSADGDYVYYSVSNHFYTTGLWRADAETGVSKTLIEGIDDEETHHLVAYPRELNDGWLYYFLTVTDEPDPNNIMPLSMHRSAPDGITDREALREDRYWLGQVLWADDASGAVVEDLSYVQESDVTNGILQWLSADGTPAVDLHISGHSLRWGLE